GMPTPPVIIEQCDLQRTVKINDKKKLYFIEPFAKDDEVIDEDVKTVKPVNKPVPTQTSAQKGGIVNMWYNITDTGERKKMYGFTARHVWTSQKIKPSPDACGMKDSMIIKTDGWYIDLPQFNCPVQLKPTKSMMPANEKQKPDCKDKFVTRRSGKGKLGFPLTETRTIIMGNSGPQTSNFETNLETLELSTEKLDSMLFEIPPGYTETKNEGDLQDKFDMGDMMKQMQGMNENTPVNKPIQNGQKPAGIIRIGVYEPQSDGQLPGAEMQLYLVNDLTSGNVEAIAVSDEEEAKKYNCDYSLSTGFVKIKQAGKVGGLLKAIKNSDPNAASSFNIESDFTLKKLEDGSIKLQQNQTGKYDGTIDGAAKKSLDEESRAVLKAIK
ncbi:MAG TPA: hypothetical protein VN451_03670, partial [Chitinophagaceae bacterium]|nr:hypothetical protein [Chitinophagaceae bacterium]